LLEEMGLPANPYLRN